MKERKHKDKIMILVILILLVGFIIFFIYIICNQQVNSLKNQDDMDSGKIIENNIGKEITTKDKEMLLAQIKDYTTILADSYPIDSLWSLNNQKALLFALNQLGATGQDFIESDLEEVLEKYFGLNHPYIHEDIQCFLEDGILYRYDSAKREYIFQDIHGHDGAGIYPVEIYYLDGHQEAGVYTVRVNILYGDYCSGTCGPTTAYYKSAKDSRNGEIPVLGPFDNYHKITNGEYQTIINALPITVFIFDKDRSKNYGLQSVIFE